MIISGGIRKLSHNNFIFEQIDKICAKDITTVNIKKLNGNKQKS